MKSVIYQIWQILVNNSLARDLAEIFSALLTFFLFIYFEVIVFFADRLIKYFFGA